MKTKKVVKYPTTISKLFESLNAICSYLGKVNTAPLRKVIESAKLPEGTLFRFDNEKDGLVFLILLPSGEIHGGAAVKDQRDKDDIILATVRAAGRAVAVYNASHHSHTGGFVELKSERDLSTRDRAIVVKTIIHELQNNGHLKRVIKSI